MFWDGRRYYSLKYFLKNRFTGKVKKISLNAGFTCPNRDGTLGYGGCIFCSGKGSGDNAGSQEKSVERQIEEGIAYNSGRYGIHQFIAYFQAFTNTYAEPEYLKQLYERVCTFKEVIGIAVATRPDCLAPDVLDVLEELNRKLYVWVELGFQTMHERTASLIRRRYDLACFEKTVSDLKARKLDIVCHTILGLPGESRADMVQTTRYLSRSGIQGIKFQLLHVLQGTELAEMFARGEVPLMKREDYIGTVADCLEALSPDIVIHRLTGDGPKDILVGPLWSKDKIGVLHDIENELERRNTWQGKLLGDISKLDPRSRDVSGDIPRQG